MVISENLLFVYAADRLEPLYILIRQKLSNALTKWHPSDRSAKLILQPWVGVFNLSHMNVFLAKNIVPKLALCMHEFTINPHQQQLGSFFLHLTFISINFILLEWKFIGSSKELKPFIIKASLFRKF